MTSTRKRVLLTKEMIDFLAPYDMGELLSVSVGAILPRGYDKFDPELGLCASYERSRRLAVASCHFDLVPGNIYLIVPNTNYKYIPRPGRKRFITLSVVDDANDNSWVSVPYLEPVMLMPNAIWDMGLLKVLWRDQMVLVSYDNLRPPFKVT